MKMKKRFLGILLSLALVIGLMMGMSLTAYADETYTVTFKANGKTVTKEVTLPYTFSCDFFSENGELDQIIKELYGLSSGFCTAGLTPKVSGTTAITVGNNNNSQYFTINESFTSTAVVTVGYSTAPNYQANLEVAFQLPSVAVTGISLDKTTAQSIAVGNSVAFTATVAPDDATDKTVKWSVGGTDTGAVKLYTDENCTTEVGTNATETLTVYAKGIFAGSANVTVTSNADSTKNANCAVTVNKKNPDATAPVGLTATYGQTLTDVTLPNPEGNTPGTWAWVDNTQSVGNVVSPAATFKANFTPTDTTTYNTVENVEVTVTVGKADPTAPTGLTATYGQTLADVALPTGWTWADSTQSVGSVVSPAATFKANFAGDDNHNAASDVDVTVTVGKAENPATVSETAQVLSGYEKIDLADYVTLNGTTGTVSYETNDEENVYELEGSILTSGEPKENVTVDVKVKIAEDANYKALEKTIKVTIISIPVTGITVEPAKDTMLIGDDLVLRVNYTPGNATDKYYETGGYDESIVDVDGAGIVYAKAAGTTTITVTATNGTDDKSDDCTATCEITVNKLDSKVTKAPETKGLTYSGQAQELVVAGEATGGKLHYAVTTENKAPAESLYTTSIPAKTDAGTYYVWYKVIGDANHYDSEAKCVTATIGSVAVTGISLNKTSTTLTVGDEETLIATVTPANATHPDLDWGSSDESVATVDGSGVVTAVADGTATITARSTDGSNKSATCVVTVTNDQIAVTGVSLNKTSTTLTVGDEETLIATVTPSNATHPDLDWGSSDESVATVDGSGIVTAVADGTATITVRSTDGSNKSATCVVTVNKKDAPVPGKSSLTADLKLGSQGAEVQALQQRLAALGYYNGAIDGDFGPVTDTAVKAFQRANGLYVDGVVGPLTRQALGYADPTSGKGTAPSSNASLVLGSTGEAVLSLQQTLMSLGYNVGALDGYFGPYTETAVKAFQRDNGLYVDGVVGPYTWAALGGGGAYVAPAEEAVAPQTAPNNGDLVYGMTSDEIAYIQLILNLLGYDVGVIDGYFGDVTLEAVKAFQRDFGLYVDGIIGAQTKAALGIQ